MYKEIELNVLVNFQNGPVWIRFDEKISSLGHIHSCFLSFSHYKFATHLKNKMILLVGNELKNQYILTCPSSTLIFRPTIHFGKNNFETLTIYRYKRFICILDAKVSSMYIGIFISLLDLYMKPSQANSIFRRKSTLIFYFINSSQIKVLKVLNTNGREKKIRSKCAIWKD